MAINTLQGISRIKDPFTGEWKPIKKIFYKTVNTGSPSDWVEVVKGYYKVGQDEWQQIYPNPIGALSASVGSLNFNPVYIGKNYQDNEVGLPITITNNGTNNLSIYDIQASDVVGFYQSLIYLGNNEYPIQLNKNNSITFNVNVFGQAAGQSTGSLLIKATDSLFGDVSLTIPVTVNVLPTFAIVSLSSYTAAFDMFSGDAAPLKIITVTNVGNGGLLDITAFTFADTTIAAYSTSGATTAIAQNGSFTITITPQSKPVGTYSTTLTLTSSDGVNPVINISLIVRAKVGRLTVSPTSITDSYTNLATQGTLKTITLQNTGNGVLNISSIISESGRTTIIGAPSTIAAGSSATFQARGIQLSASTTDRIVISSNAQDASITYIPVTYNITILRAVLNTAPTALAATDWQLVDNLPETINAITLTNSSEGTAGREITISGITFQSGSTNPSLAKGTVVSVSPSLPATRTAGQTLTFRLKLNQNYTGTTTDKIIIASTAENTSLELPLTYNYITPPPPPAVISVSTAITVQTSTIKQGSDTSLEFKVTNNSTSTVAIEITAMSSKTGLLSFKTSTNSSISFPVSLSPGQFQTFKADCDYSGKPVGTVSDELTVSYEDAVAQSPTTLLSKVGFSTVIRALYPADPIVTPTSFTNTAILQGAAAFTRSQVITITNKSSAEQNLVLNSIGSTSGKVTLTTPTAPVTIAPGGSQALTFSFNYSTLSAAPNGFVDTISLVTNVSTLTVTATTVINPLIGTLSFQTTGGSASSSINIAVDKTASPADTVQRVIKNTGTGPLNVTSLTSESSRFSVSPTSITNLAVNATQTITLTFAGSRYDDVGKYTDYLRMENNGSSSLVRIPLTIRVGYPAGQKAFNTSTDGSDFIVPYTIYNITYFIAGGGGGGGASTEGANGGGGGGGGGGGYITGKITSVAKGKGIRPTVGAAGAGSSATTASNLTDGYTGGTSKLEIRKGSQVEETYAAAGGGGGKKGYANSQSAGNGAGGVCPTDSSRNGLPGYTNGQGDKSDAFGGAGGAGVEINGAVRGKGGSGGSIQDRVSPYYDNGNAGTQGYIFYTWPAYTPPT